MSVDSLTPTEKPYAPRRMKITLTHDLVRDRLTEGSSFSLTASFYNDSWTATAPTSARYRIDRVNSSDPSCYEQILAWTSLSPATSNAITVTGAQNAITNDGQHEQRMQITVQGDTGLSTQYQVTKNWWVQNLAGQS